MRRCTKEQNAIEIAIRAEQAKSLELLLERDTNANATTNAGHAFYSTGAGAPRFQFGSDHPIACGMVPIQILQVSCRPVLNTTTQHN